MKQLKFIWGYLKGNRIKMITMMVVVLIYVTLNLISPLLFSFLIDNVINGDVITNDFIKLFSDLLGGVEHIKNNLWIGAAVVIAINIFVCLAIFFRGKWNGQIAETVSMNIRNHLYSHLQLLPYSYHIKAKTGDLIQRCTSDVDTIRRFLAGQISEMVYSIATACIAVVILFSIYPPMAILAVISMPILFAFGFVFFRNMQKAFLASDEAEGHLSTMIQESLSGVRVIKAFNREEYEIDRFEKKNKIFKDLTYKVIRLLGVYWGTSDFICLTQILVIVIAGIFAANAGVISVGSFFVFISYEGMILWPVRNLGRILADMGKMSVSINRISEILDSPLEDVDTGITCEISGNIEFNHVYFKYDDGEVDVLKDVSFKINHGETIALIGPTGSGKSSLVHLLTRLYDYQSGSILIDGVELNTIQRKFLRKKIGIVLQEPFLFSKSIYENIHLANPAADKKDIYKAAQIASVHDVIEEFEYGYETLVGEKGVTLSGGQKQRIAIARTIVNNAPILIFDDSLSAVDTQTDAQIRDGLQKLSKGVTTLIITQRISSAQNADQILVLEKGTITQSGKHEQLINEEGLYKRIYEIQSAMIQGGEDNEQKI